MDVVFSGILRKQRAQQVDGDGERDGSWIQGRRVGLRNRSAENVQHELRHNDIHRIEEYCKKNVPTFILFPMFLKGEDIVPTTTCRRLFFGHHPKQWLPASSILAIKLLSGQVQN